MGLSNWGYNLFGIKSIVTLFVTLVTKSHDPLSMAVQNKWPTLHGQVTGHDDASRGRRKLSRFSPKGLGSRGLGFKFRAWFRGLGFRGLGYKLRASLRRSSEQKPLWMP